MTDQEIIRLVTEKVMGYTNTDPDNLYAPWYRKPNSNVDFRFDPLTSDADACAVLDRMVELGWYWYGGYCMDSMEPHRICHHVQFFRTIDEIGHAQEDNRRRAICFAALKAVGVEVG